MKHFIKMVSVLVFAVLLSGCLPHEKLTGRVIDTAGPVPEAAVLGMVWIEDADKARSAPDTEDLKPEERTTAFEKDMKDRGLPVAYARAFSDKDGWFTLDKLNFSAETRKAVKAMKQPKITRITVFAFQRGYLKHAVTTFPKPIAEELPPATIMLARPESWKELALDSSYRMLRRDEYDAGYSKEFGATKEEKEWFLEYTNSNLNKAYAESNIKGDKRWEEDCGHDYNDVIISTAGMQRNPVREKCNRLLHQMGVLREWKKEWLDHSLARTEKPEPAVSAIKAALEALGPEYAEVKANEGYIIAGVDEAENQHRKSQTNQNLRNGMNDNSIGTEEARRLYNTGDKAGAYKALGGVLYSQMPDEVRQGPLTAQLTIKTIPGITDAVSGFYLLMNRPLTAQLPGGDGGNHKDKPGYRVEGATETANVQKTQKAADDDIEIDGDKIKRSALYKGSDGAVLESREVKDKDAEGRPEDKFIERKAFGSTGADYVLRSHSVLSGMGDEEPGSYEKSVFELFDIKGGKLFEKDLGNRDFQQAWIFKNGTSVIYTHENPSLGVDIYRYQIYDRRGSLLKEIANTAGMYDLFIKDFQISNGINIRRFTMSPEADFGIFTVKVSDKKFNLYKLEPSGILTDIVNISGDSISVTIKDANKILVFDKGESEKTALSGKKYWNKHIMFFSDSILQWEITLEAEDFLVKYGGWSKTGKYLIVGYLNEITWDRDQQIAWKEYYKIIEVSTGKIVAAGVRDDAVIEQYKAELLPK